MSEQQMHLKIMVPEQIMENMKVNKVIAEAINGFFCLKPRHVDFTSALKPGILYYYCEDERENGSREHLMAVSRGILVKCGSDVRVSVLNAMKSDNLEELHQRVHDEFLRMQQTEESATYALRNLEMDLIQRFIELEKGLEVKL
jgi:F-type H+-transporting ATPase subunit epsilon